MWIIHYEYELSQITPLNCRVGEVSTLKNDGTFFIDMYCFIIGSFHGLAFFIYKISGCILCGMDNIKRVTRNITL